MSTLDDVKQYYKDLLLYQYINSPKALATIDLLCNQALSDLLPIYVNDSFDIETSEGPQQDIIGEFIGFNRDILISIDRIYMGLENSDSPFGDLYGLTDYDSTINNQSFLYNYQDSLGANYTLNDDEYRLLLKLKAYTNRSNHSLGEIYSYIYPTFSGKLSLIDNFDMTITYFAHSDISNIILIAKQNYLLPKPMGVLIHLFEVDDVSLLMSLDFNSSIGLTNYDSDINSNSQLLDYEDYL